MDTDGSMAYNSASNGLPERHVPVLLQSTRAALLQSQLPITYWDYAVRHVAWSNNMVLTARLKRRRTNWPSDTPVRTFIISGRSVVDAVSTCDFKASDFQVSPPRRRVH